MRVRETATVAQQKRSPQQDKARPVTILRLTAFGLNRSVTPWKIGNPTAGVPAAQSICSTPGSLIGKCVAGSSGTFSAIQWFGSVTNDWLAIQLIGFSLIQASKCFLVPRARWNGKPLRHIADAPLGKPNISAFSRYRRSFRASSIVDGEALVLMRSAQ